MVMSGGYLCGGSLILYPGVVTSDERFNALDNSFSVYIYVHTDRSEVTFTWPDLEGWNIQSDLNAR